ncbi:MAG: rane protein [Deltaproteobacteria bacterium]|nr:rane protein [Deltaproteobacteria bacterium]MBP1718748.1 rane protein [Deltaproteobacteria bacterium]
MFLPLKDDNPTNTFPFVTVALILANCFVFYHQLTLSLPAAQKFIFQWGAIPYQIVHGEVLYGKGLFPPFLTLFSSMFLHGGFLHLIGNMLYLWIFGNNIEDSLGHFRFLLFYLLTGLGAALAQVFSDPQSTTPMIGASGAVAGVLGAYLLLFPHARILTLMFIFVFIRMIRIPALIVLGFWFLVQLLSVTSGFETGVAFFAHIGGFVAGLILVKIFQTQKARRRR